MNPPRVEPLELVQEVPATGAAEPSLNERIFDRIVAELGEGTYRIMRRNGELVPVSIDISPELRAWIERRERERYGLPLRQCDREQLSRQMEDLGGL